MGKRVLKNCWWRGSGGIGQGSSHGVMCRVSGTLLLNFLKFFHVGGVVSIMLVLTTHYIGLISVELWIFL